MGGGLELALSCDCILVTKNKKVRLGLPEVNLGICPGFGGPHRLAERTGAKDADYLINTGRILTAEEAIRFNIIDDVISESKQFLYKNLVRIYGRRRRFARVDEKRSILNKIEREALAGKIFQEPARNSLASYSA